eukprot:gene22641-30919_t
MGDEFNNYLRYLLDDVEIDSDVYSSFIISILDDSDLREEYQQLETEKTFSHTDSIFEFDPQYSAVSDEYQPTAKDDYPVDKLEDDIAENSDTIDAHGEELQQLYNNYMHWMYLIDQVDSKANPSPSSTERFSADAISCALHSTESDIDKSVEALLYTKHIADTCRPCRHALTSRCMRKDCYFDHNMSEIPCRFWLLDVCLKHQASYGSDAPVDESGCPFQHAVLCADPLQPSRSGTQPSTKSLSNDDSHFPALMPSSSSSKWIGKPIGKTKFVRNASAQASKNYKAAITSMPYKSYACPTIVSSDHTTAKYRGDSSSWWQSSNNVGYKKFPVNSPSIPVLPSEWVESGQSVAVNYATLRCDAIEYAKGRNKLLEAATRAYLLGDRAVAKNLSNEGQRLNTLMKSCHEKAAQQIFRTRNSPQSLMRGQVDLHGLHVAEAQECISVIVPILEQMNVKHIHIITGSGHHTVGPQRGVARLMPSVQSTLDAMGYKTVPVKDANGYIGGFQIVNQGKRS